MTVCRGNRRYLCNIVYTSAADAVRTTRPEAARFNPLDAHRPHVTSESQTRPVIVYDDDCGFCARSVEYAVRRGDFDVAGFSELSEAQRARLPGGYRRCAHLLTDEAVYSCGAATEEILTRLDAPVALAARAFRRVPASERVRDPLYRWVADHRSWFGKLVR